MSLFGKNRKNILKNNLFSMVAGSALGLATAASAADPIKMYANDAVPPKAWREGAQTQGYVIDATREAFRRAGVELLLEAAPFKRAYTQAEAGEGWLTGIFKTPDREKIFLFSEPVGVDEVILVVAKGREFAFEKAEDLTGKRIGYQDGASYGASFVEAQKHFQGDADSNPRQRLQKLLAGRLDAAIINPGEAALAYQMKALGEPLDKVTVLPKRIASESNHIIVARSQEAVAAPILAKINVALKAMAAEGMMDKIMENYRR
jgi:ABC-type amino acid transport substrate-binding protein